MKIEHTAFQVADPVTLSRWYSQHLGLTVKRAQAASPWGHFLADDGDTVMLEFYCNPTIPVPDYATMHPLTLHLAFEVEDVSATRARLLGAGATSEGDIQTNDVGDTVTMLRDPSGLALQLVQRSAPMLAPRGSRS